MLGVFNGPISPFVRRYFGLPFVFESSTASTQFPSGITLQFYLWRSASTRHDRIRFKPPILQAGHRPHFGPREAVLLPKPRVIRLKCEPLRGRILMHIMIKQNFLK
jgi:hypothetical protein